MLLATLLVVLGLLLIFAVIVGLKKPDYHLSRSIIISRPPSAVFPAINDLRRYSIWNPFGKADPAMRTTFEGPAAGPGAILDWSGNNRVGAGRMSITENQPNDFVRIRLDFLKPFPSTAVVEFTLVPKGNGTLVTWSMSGQHSTIPKAMSVFVDFSQIIGGEFEKGLAELKRMVEAPFTPDRPH